MEFYYRNTVLNRLRSLPVLRYSGLSIPDKDHLSARAPRQHGATYLATYFTPREFTLEWWMRGCDPEEYEQRHRDMAQILSPLDDGELGIISADGNRYTLACHLITALEVNRLDAGAAEVLAQFIADDPFFRSAAVSQAFTLALVPPLTIPFTIPALIGGGYSASVTRTVSGHLETFPEFTLAAGATGVRLENTTTGGSLYINTTVAGSLEVDMAAKTVESVVGATRTSLIGYVTGDFWALQVGSNTIRISIEAGGTLAGTMSYLEKYLAVI